MFTREQRDALTDAYDGAARAAARLLVQIPYRLVVEAGVERGTITREQADEAGDDWPQFVRDLAGQ